MRPKNADSEETWNQIVDAARRELVSDQHGGASLSLRKVASAADVSLGTIHYYFPEKEALLEACLDAYYSALAALTTELADALNRADRGNARATLAESVRRIYRFAVSEQPRLKLRAATNAARGHLHPQRDAHVRGPYLQWLAPVVQRIADVDLMTTRMAIQTMSFAVMHYALLSDAELTQIVGVGGAAGLQKVEDHLVHVALGLIFAR